MSHEISSQAGEVVVRPDLPFNGIKVFSATMFADRDRLGEKVTDWMAAHRDLPVTRFMVTQSTPASSRYAFRRAMAIWTADFATTG